MRARVYVRVHTGDIPAHCLLLFACVSPPRFYSSYEETSLPGDFYPILFLVEGASLSGGVKWLSSQ